MSRWQKMGAVAFLVLAVGAAATAFYLMFSGPRMRVQPKLLPYQAPMPPVPEGTVPVAGRVAGIPSASSGQALAARVEGVPPSNRGPEALDTRGQDVRDTEAGRVYYGYYCAFCHGETGRGDGPVGVSYVPVPTDLTLPQVAALSDSALQEAMLTGVGHEPVLDRVVEARARRYIIHYVRTLSRE
jgi:mono/diheme cytochrome c family protein